MPENRESPTDWPMDAVRQLILNRASELERPLSELSLKIGRNHAYLQQFIRRGVPVDLPEKVRGPLAAELKVPENSLRGGEVVNHPKSNAETPFVGDRTHSMVDTIRTTPIEEIPASKLLGERDLPVFATAQGGKGAIVLSNDPVEWVVRPEPLARVKDGYGVIVMEDSMMPEFRSGDTALVNPHLPPRSGDTCVFRSFQEDGTIMACVKYLRRATAEAWLVTEWNSPEGVKRDFQLKKSEWQIAHVTVGSYKRS